MLQNQDVMNNRFLATYSTNDFDRSTISQYSNKTTKCNIYSRTSLLGPPLLENALKTGWSHY